MSQPLTVAGRNLSVRNRPGWAGWYVGAVAGGALQNTIIDDKNCNLSCSSLDRNGSGFTGGGTLGWNAVIGAALVGAEADINWADFKSPDLIDPDWRSANGSVHSTRWNWFSTIRARGGLVVDRALVYITGGLALVDIEASGHQSAACTGPATCFSISKVQAGLAAGVGAEYLIGGPWSTKAEYLYIALAALYTHDLVQTADTSAVYGVKSDAHVLRVGVDYHLN